MAQFARPSADTLIDNWEDEAGGGTNLYTHIDEVSADDVDFLRTVVQPTNDVYVTKLTAVTDPVSSTGHTIRWRYKKDIAGGGSVTIVMNLRQDYVDESSQGTLIKSFTSGNISDTWTTGQVTLTPGEADLITDYTNLYLRFLGNVI